MDRLILDFILLICFLGVSAFLAGAEAAYFSLSRLGTAQLEPKESPGHALLERILRDPRDLLITLLVGITLVNIAASALAAQVATVLFGPSGSGSRSRSWFSSRRFGEVLLMTIAVGTPHRFGLFVARPALALQWLTPVRSRWARSPGWSPAPPMATGWPKRLSPRRSPHPGRGRRAWSAQEREMIHGVFELGETTVAAVMVPRTDVFGLDVATPTERLLPAIRSNLHHRVPIYEGSLDHVLGILQTKELLPFYAGLPPDFDLRRHLAPPYFVPQSKRADALSASSR
jgi:putative hemolysin